MSYFYDKTGYLIISIGSFRTVRSIGLESSTQSSRFVSPLAIAILVWISTHGPTGVRKLREEGHFNPTTIKPVLQELLQKGFLSQEEKPKAKPGNPLPYHITRDGIRIVVGDWDSVATQERLEATHRDNYADLILDLITPEPTTNLPVPQEQGMLVRHTIDASKPLSSIPPELYESVLELARRKDPESRGAQTWAFWLILCINNLELYRKIFLTPIQTLEARFRGARIPEEPGTIRSAIWLTLFVLGFTLIGVGQWLGVVPLAIDAGMYYQDYVRNSATTTQTMAA